MKKPIILLLLSSASLQAAPLQKIRSTGVIHQTAESGIGSAVGEQLDVILGRLGKNDDLPGRLFATIPPNTLLHIRAMRIPAGNGGTKNMGQIATLIPTGTADITVDAISATVSGGTLTRNGGAFSFPSASTGDCVRVVFAAQGDSSIDSNFSSVLSSCSGTLTNPGTLFTIISGSPLGWVDLTKVASGWKTTGSLGLSAVVENVGISRIGDGFLIGSPLLNPMTTAGDTIYGGIGGTTMRLAAGSSSQVLHSGSTPSWGQVSLTADVSGILPLASGGSNKALTAASGGLLWTDSDSFEVSSPGTASQWVLSGGSGAPTMSNTTTSGKVIDGSADEIQLRVQDAAGQTSDSFVVEDSSGADLLNVSNVGALAVGAAGTNFDHSFNGRSVSFLATGGNAARLRFFADGTERSFLGNNGTGSTYISGTTVSDMVLVAKAGQIALSVDDGTSVNMKVASTGAIVLGKSGASTVNVSNGAMSMTGTGGNVPHNCSWEQTTGSIGATGSHTCSAGKTATSGGCYKAITPSEIRRSTPDTSVFFGDTWTCTFASGLAAPTVYAYCCNL